MVDILVSGGRPHRGHAVYTPATCGTVSHTSLLLVPAAMLPRRTSTNATPIRVPPRPGGSGGDKQPLSLATGRQVSGAPTIMEVETESPVSEMPPQEFPPMPTQPMPFSHPSPGNSGLGEQSALRNTHKPFPSAFGERAPPQPPSMPMVIMPRISEPPPPTPRRPRRPTRGGSVGGFLLASSPYRRFSSGYSRRYTRGYTNPFDTMPTPHLDSGPHHYESADISGGTHANVWPIYNEISKEVDKKRLDKWNDDLDVLLIFVGLMIGAGH